MNPTIEIPDNVAAALQAQALAQGVSAARLASQVIENTIAPAIEEESTSRPFETGYGTWAWYGSAPSAEKLAENRREMFRNFAQDAG